MPVLTICRGLAATTTKRGGELIWNGFLWLFGASLYCLVVVIILIILGKIKEFIDYKIQRRQYLKDQQIRFQQSEVEK